MTEIVLEINGSTVKVAVAADETLLHTLRDGLGLRSVRYCCGIGVCGTCSVLLDGQPVSSCLTLSVLVGERPVRTAEGLDPEGSVARAFVACSAFQCSYCIPGMVVTATGVLTADPEADASHLRDALGGNLCRCGSYPQVVEALVQAAGSGPGAPISRRAADPGPVQAAGPEVDG